VIDSLRREDPEFLLVDAGDFTGTPSPASEATSLFLLEMMGRLGYDAASPGVLDLSLGRDLLVSLASNGPVPLVSANLRGPDGERLDLSDRLLVERNGVLVGITGVLVVPDRLRSEVEGSGFSVADPRTALEPVLRDLRRQAGVVVLLADGPTREIHALGERLRGLIDVVVVGESGSRPGLQHPEHGGALYLSAMSKGQALGRARIGMKDGRVDRIVGDEIVLFRDVFEDPEVAQMVDDFADTLNELLRSHRLAEARDRVAPDGHAYLGVEGCASCHVREYRIWLETPHASAMQTLVEEGRDATPECFRCHVTGHGDPTGYALGAETAAGLRNVQCEVCHDKGTRHARDGSYGRNRLMESCVECHDPENSPDWDPEVYWLMMEH
jgi:hypothetical protein